MSQNAAKMPPGPKTKASDGGPTGTLARWLFDNQISKSLGARG